MRPTGLKSGSENMDLNAFARRMEQRAKRLPIAVNEIKKEVVAAIGNDLIDVTPVDTSEALSNWQGSIGAPGAFAIPAIVAGERGSTQVASAVEAKAHLDRVLREVLPGEAVFLTNSTPQIVPLNEGSSTQEPRGFVERAVLRGRLALRNAKLKLD